MMDLKKLFESVKKKIGEYSKNSVGDYKVHTDETGKRTDSGKKPKYNIVAMILCVLAAFVLWFYVINEQSPSSERTFSDIPINFINVSSMREGLAVVSGYDNTVEVVLSGKKSDLNRISSKDIKATVDLSGISDAGEYPMSISVVSPSNTSVKLQTPGSLYVYVDKTVTRTVEIRCEYTGGTTDNENLMIGTLEPAKKYVSITGPEEEVLKVSNGLVSISLGLIDKTVRLREKIELVDADSNKISNPYIKTDITDVDVSVPVFRIKELPVSIRYQNGYFDEETIKAKVSPEKVTVKGPVDVIESLDALYTEFVDESQIGGSASLRLSCVMPDGVSYYGTDPAIKADISVENYSTKTMKIPRQSISITGLDDGLTAEILDASVEVVFAGDENYLSLIRPTAVKLTLDLSSVSAPGLYKETPLTVARPFKNVYAVNADSYSTDISVTQKGSEN